MATKWAVYEGDVLACLALMADNSQHACLTDAPYGLGKNGDPLAMLRAWLGGDPYNPGGGGFMGKAWDSFVPGPEIWREVYRVLKPGASLMCFAGDRTEDIMGLAIRLAGFEKIGTIPWLYGSGFPKNFNIAAAIDKRMGATRPIVGRRHHTPKFQDAGNGGFNKRAGLTGLNPGGRTSYVYTSAASLEARLWQGHGTRLKPAYEPCLWFMKPIDGTYANNALAHGVAGINVDAGRLIAESGWRASGQASGAGMPTVSALGGTLNNAGRSGAHELGRWPTNVIISPEVAARLGPELAAYFYCAKPDGAERDAGIQSDARESHELVDRKAGSAGMSSPRAGAGRTSKRRNTHPTVKPIDLMRYLALLLLPPDTGTPREIFVPFAGSGSDMIGCLLAGWDRVLGAEISPESCAIARDRLDHWASLDTPKATRAAQLPLFG